MQIFIVNLTVDRIGNQLDKVVGGSGELTKDNVLKEFNVIKAAIESNDDDVMTKYIANVEVTKEDGSKQTAVLNVTKETILMVADYLSQQDQSQQAPPPPTPLNDGSGNAGGDTAAINNEENQQ